MIVRRKEDVIGTKGDINGERWHSLRLLHEEDGMHVTLTDTILEAGFKMDLWQKNHLEACYCIEGEGTVEEVDSGTIHEVRPGTLYSNEQSRSPSNHCEDSHADFLYVLPSPDRS